MDSLKGKPWVIGDRLTIADFSIGGLLPTAELLELSISPFRELYRWYRDLASLPAWQQAVAAREAAHASWLATNAAR